MLKGECVSELARELKVRRTQLYKWKDNYRRGGKERLRLRGRPWKEIGERRKTPQKSAGTGKEAKRGGQRIAELERQVAQLERQLGQKELELDFFETALQRIEQDQTLATDSLKSSARRRSKAD
jgi:transposase